MAINGVEINESNLGEIQDLIDNLGGNGGGFVVLSSGLQKSKIDYNLPSNVRLIDLRYGGISIQNKSHPRGEGIWTQYSHLDTGLSKNIVISDTITNDTAIENWKSERHEMQIAPYGTSLTSEDYRHMHNHYQNLLCETFNFSSDLNAVSVWGDSGAFVPGAKSWGAFFSARSWPVRWNGYTPQEVFDSYDDSEFDAALVGIEIDILNNGLDWREVSPKLSSSMAKVGLQIVGFGKKNTAAIEIRTEDSDDPSNTPETRRGAWEWGIIARNCLHEKSTLFYSENGLISKGIDLSKTTFKDGALCISGAGDRSGILFDDAKSGQIFAENNNVMVIDVPNGAALKVKVGEEEYLEIDSSLNIEITPSLRRALVRALLDA